MHLAHATSIPFENLDPIRGVPNSLLPEDLENKMVTFGRGGYCFEQNLLFAEALRDLGITEIQPVLARVRAGNRPGPRPRTHLLLKVTHEGDVWHADVGFGADGLLSPIPYGPGVIHEQHGWRYRIIEDGREFVLQMEQEGAFQDLYGFIDEPALPIDMEVSNWYVSTCPRSAFTTALYCSFQEPGRRWILSERGGPFLLTTKTPSSKQEHVLERAEVPTTLETLFHLPGLVDTPQGWELP